MKQTISRKGKTFQKTYDHRYYGAYTVPITRKDYVKLQLGLKNGSINQIVREFLKHIGPEYFIVQTHQHGQPYIVRLFTEVKPDDGPIVWAENTQLHTAMYELMSEYLWHCQQVALEQFNAEQARLYAETEQAYVSIGAWTPEAVVDTISLDEVARRLGNTHG